MINLKQSELYNCRRFIEDEDLLVVNAGNRDRDWDHLQKWIENCIDVERADRSEEMDMVSLQGHASRTIIKDAYQSAVIANAKTIARSLADCGLQVAVDPAIGFTATHRVLLYVEYGSGPQVARQLEENNIICNCQTGPADQSFSASGMMRMGIAEMTPFGMGKEGLDELAQILRDPIVDGMDAKAEVTALRQNYLGLNDCFRDADAENQMETILTSLQSSFASSNRDRAMTPGEKEKSTV
jgi:hypothetical protein